MLQLVNFSRGTKSVLAVILSVSFLAIGATSSTAIPSPDSVIQVSPSVGSTLGGVSVLVSGFEARGATGVNVGGVTARDIVFADDYLSVTFTAPAGSAGPADIIIENLGSELTLVEAFTYVENSAPVSEATTVSLISPTSGAASGGDLITIKGSGLDRVEAVLVGTNPAKDLQIDPSADSLTAISPSGEAGTVSITLVVAEELIVTQLEYTYEAPKLNSQIVNGDAAAISDAPWQVQVTPKYGGATFLCGGSLIAADWVVTAAHCVDGTPTSVTVRAGSATLDAGLEKNVSNVYVHPSYIDNDTFRYDIALLKLSSAYTLASGSIEVILLPTSERKSATEWPANGSTALITGWGRTSSVGAISDVLRKANVNVLGSPTTSTCGSYSSAYQSAIMLCAQGGSAPNYTDACSGDSGGPLAEPVGLGSSLHYLAGVTSFGVGCGEANYPGVWTRTTAFVDWMVPGRAATLNAVPGDGQMTVTATPPTSLPQLPITHWMLFRNNPDNNGFDGIAAGTYNSSSPPVSYIDTGLVNGTSYQYMFIYLNEVNFNTPLNYNAAFSETVMVEPPPAVPTVDFIVSGDKMVYAEYSAARADSFNISVYTAPTGGSYVTGYGASTDVFLLSPEQLLLSEGLVNGTTYYLEVKAKNASGVTASSTRRAFTPTATANPSVATIQSLSTNGFDKGWQLYTETSGGSYRTAYYFSFLSDNPSNLTWQLMSKSYSPTPLTSIDSYNQSSTVITNGVTYFASAVVIGDTGISARSDRLPVTPRATPVNIYLTGSGTTPASIELSWNTPRAFDGSPMSITGYRIEYTTNAGATWQTAILDTGTIATTRTMSGLDPAKVYSFRTAAIVSAGVGAWSNGSAPITPSKTPQIVSWAPSNTTVDLTAGTLTPNILASALGGASVAYAVANAGSTGCTVNSLTGVLSFTGSGTCSISATAAETTDYSQGSTLVAFSITAPPSPSPSGGGSSEGGGGSVEATAPTSTPAPTTSQTPVTTPTTTPYSAPPFVINNPSSVKASEVSAISPQQIATVAPEVFRALAPAALRGITPDQAERLTTAQVNNIRPNGAAQLRPATVASLAPANITAMRPASIARLTPNAVWAMSEEQIQAIRPEAVAKMTSLQLKGMSPSQVSSMTSSQLKALSDRQIKDLTKSQVSALSKGQKKLLGL